MDNQRDDKTVSQADYMSLKKPIPPLSSKFEFRGKEKWKWHDMNTNLWIIDLGRHFIFKKLVKVTNLQYTYVYTD